MKTNSNKHGSCRTASQCSWFAYANHGICGLLKQRTNPHWDALRAPPVFVVLLLFIFAFSLSTSVSAETPEELLAQGRQLDQYANQVNNDAEQACYRGKGPHTPQCMANYAEKMNAKYGARAFQFIPTQIIIRYTGTHYQQVLDNYPNSPAAAEAAYHFLEKNLIGNPDEVLKRVQDYMAKYSKGPWNLKARLLVARLNEDIWWIHRKWSWMLYNGSVSEDELVVRGEKYRQAAVKAYEELIKKSGGSPEGKIAKQELTSVKNNQDDGKLYGIVSDAITSGEAGFQRKSDR